LRRNTYWLHEYNVGKIVSSGSNQVDEGVGDLHEIIADAQEKKFVLANVTTMNVRADDVKWTNIIFTSPGEGPHTNDLRRFMAINEKFLATLPPGEAATMGSKVLFVTTSVAPNGEEVLTLYTRTSHGKWVGFARSLTYFKAGTIAELERHLRRIGNGGRLFVYGDPLPSLDFTALADKAGVDTIRRIGDVEKRFLDTHTGG
jgi:hypothetical protein